MEKITIEVFNAKQRKYEWVVISQIITLAQAKEYIGAYFYGYNEESDDMVYRIGIDEFAIIGNEKGERF